MAKALEDMGIAGKGCLRDALTNTTDPLGAIEEFQQENSILLPSLQPALPLLDLHGLRRIDFHQSVFEVLRDRLLAQIAEISKNNQEDAVDKLEAILEKSFSLIKIEALLPVSMCLLQNLSKVPERYITALIKDPNLYKASPIQVKRQIWQKNQTMFGDEVLPLLTKYIKEKEETLMTCDCTIASNFFSSSPKSRRQAHVVKTLTDMIGKNIRLYDMVLQFLRTLFLKTHNVHYCSLRAEILMALHDLEVTEVCSVDPCYKFTWCLDACIRERFVDVKRARELQGFLDSIKKGHEQVLGDLSMILCDPFAVNTMLWSVVKILHEVTVKETLPRDNTELKLLIRMLALGQSAWEIINKQVFKEPKIDQEIWTRYLPSLMGLGLLEQISSMKARLKSLDKKANETEASKPVEKPGDKNSKKKNRGKKTLDAFVSREKSTSVDRWCDLLQFLILAAAHESPQTKSSNNTDDAVKPQEAESEEPSVLLPFVTKCLAKDQLTRLLTMWHILYLVKHKRKSQLLELLPVLAKTSKDYSSDSVFIHVLVAHFTTCSDMLIDDALCQAVFSKFLMSPKTLKEIQQRQILKFIISVCHKIPAARLKTITAKMEPKSKKGSEQVQELFAAVKEKVASLQSTSAPPDNPDASGSQNLLGVPTPAPL